MGRATVRATREAYPVPLTISIQRIRGSGDLWVVENAITYDGMPRHTVHILELRDGKVVHETIYFGEPWEVPTWRAPWVAASGPT